MSKWREKEWRIPRKGEVVKDIDGNLGIVIGSFGTLNSKKLWIANVNGTEIYSEEDAENFLIVDLEISKEFHLEKLSLKGFKEGALCMFKDNEEVPLEVIHIEWNAIRCIPIIWLKDLRRFDDNILKTDNEQLLSPFDLNMPPLETIFSFTDSGLKWRIEINLIEVDRQGWAGCGSPWEFSSKESALDEVDNWKSRLKIRRLASVINSNWKIEFPCWSIELQDKEVTTGRVKMIESFCGLPAYFPTSLHAATALKMLPIEDWKKAFISSQDPLF